MAEKNMQPIIIKRKKGHGHGAHGGAWKVAYADFVTAMMAFFLVMWLLGSDDETKAAVSNYFNNPTSSLRLDMTNKDAIPLGDQTGAGESLLHGAEGEVPEQLVKDPNKPALEGNTKADDPADVAERIVSSGDKFQVEVMKFSIAEKDLFKAGSPEEFLPSAAVLLAKIGKLTRNQNLARVRIRGTVAEDTGNYEFQVSRTVAVGRYLVDKKILEEDRISTSVVKRRHGEDRSPASGPRVEFDITVRDKE